MARYIDAENFLESIIEKFKCVPLVGVTKYINGEEYFEGNTLDILINEQPTADVEEVRHGQWLPQIVSGVKAWDCSECKTLGSPHWKRCPICEAKMDGGKRNEL